MNHLIQLWPGYLVKHLEKINQLVGINNRLTMDRWVKRIVLPFKRQEFCKLIGCILSAVTYGKKGHKIWIEIPKSSCRISPTKLQIDVRGNTDLFQVCCAHYRHFYIYAFHWIVLSYTNLFISWMFLWLITSLYPFTGLWHVLDKV